MVVDQLSAQEADLVFHAMADATRRDILVQVGHAEESVSALSRRYEMSFAAVQKHVAVLERARLVRKERRGREQIVHADTATLCRTIDLLGEYEQLWIKRAGQIEDLLATEERDGR
jgi:DNA-binding transcriptional ArsR family regulator